jgi:hypothetical protein
MSGYSGSFAGSVFTQIGIDNIPGNLANPANIAVAQDGTTVCTNKFNDPSPSVGCWMVKQDVNASGGFNVDFLAQASNGVNRTIDASCENGPEMLHTCYAARPVMLSFDITSNFNPVTQGQVYIHAEGINDDVSVISECETGASVTLRERCTDGIQFDANPPVVATPEPATLALMATGLFALWPAAMRSLRRRKEVSGQA